MNEYQTLLPLHMYLYFTFVTLSYGKRAKTAEMTTNRLFGECFEADLLNICVKFGGWHTENDKI